MVDGWRFKGACDPKHEMKVKRGQSVGCEDAESTKLDGIRSDWKKSRKGSDEDSFTYMAPWKILNPDSEKVK
ncbi:hypothetical protein ACFX2I_008475 [Malus domestica]